VTHGKSTGDLALITGFSDHKAQPERFEQVDRFMNGLV
jgi:hypothetical protein